MRFNINRNGIEIVPESKIDEAYIEDTLGLKREGDAIPLVRQNVFSTHAIANLSTAPFPVKAIFLVQKYDIPYAPLAERDPDDNVTSPETPSAKKEP
jgi:hypothetical protein